MDKPKHPAILAAENGEDVLVITTSNTEIPRLLAEWEKQTTGRAYRAAGVARLEPDYGGVVWFLSQRSHGGARGRAVDLVYFMPGIHLTQQLLAEVSPCIATRPGGRLILEIDPRHFD